LATPKASAASVVTPIVRARTTVLIKPRILEAMVPLAMMIEDLATPIKIP
jgi:hypothetical protein